MGTKVEPELFEAFEAAADDYLARRHQTKNKSELMRMIFREWMVAQGYAVVRPGQPVRPSLKKSAMLEKK